MLSSIVSVLLTLLYMFVMYIGGFLSGFYWLPWGPGFL